MEGIVCFTEQKLFESKAINEEPHLGRECKYVVSWSSIFF